MHMTRRALLRSLSALASAAVCGGPLLAANRAGLAPGSFVWQPRLVPPGPLLIAFSAEDELVRIYRGGAEIGISTCRIRSPRDSIGWSVFSVGEEAGGRHGGPLAWAGAPIYATPQRGKPVAAPLVELPADLARLLAAATSGPSVVVLANASPHAAMVSGPGLLPSGASLIETQALGGKSAGDLRAESDPSWATTLVVSSVDRMAYLCRPGQPEVSSAIELVDPGKPLGDRLFHLVELGSTAERTRWLGVDLAAQGTSAADALSRVSLVGGPLTPYVVVSALGAGSTLLMTDSPAPPSTRRSGRHHTVLSSPGAAAPRANRAPAKPQRTQSVELGSAIRPLRFFKDY